MTSSINKTFSSIIFGTLSIIAGIIVTFSQPWLVPKIILAPNQTIEEFWRKPPVKIPMDIYLFNWTNSEEIHNLSSKPKFQQIGPYRFVQELEKIDLVWNDNNTVTYRQKRTWFFDEQNSKRDMSDHAVTFNLLAWYLAYTAQDWSYFTKLGISAGLNAICPNNYVAKSVKELFYEGLCEEFGQDVLKNFLFVLPEFPKADNLGLLSFRNGSLADTVLDEVYNVGIGINGDYDIHQFNYRNKTHFEGSCGKVRGSAGELYSRRSKDFAELFLPDACRRFAFEYEEDVLVDNILGYKYSLGNSVLDNGTLLPENKCYCPGECMPSGMLNLTDCFFGCPVFMSLPNFYSADPVYLNDVEGLQPEAEKHGSYIIIEPNTGVPLKVVLKIQANIFIHHVGGIPIFENIPKMYFPFLWIDIDFKIPEEMLELIKYLLVIPIIFNTISYILIIIGLCFLTAGVACYIFCKNPSLRNHILFLKPEEVPLQGVRKYPREVIIKESVSAGVARN